MKPIGNCSKWTRVRRHDGFSRVDALGLLLAIAFSGLAFAPLPSANVGGSHVGLFGGSAQYLSRREFQAHAGGPTAPTVRAPNRAWCDPDSATGGR